MPVTTERGMFERRDEQSAPQAAEETGPGDVDQRLQEKRGQGQPQQGGERANVEGDELLDAEKRAIVVAVPENGDRAAEIGEVAAQRMPMRGNAPPMADHCAGQALFEKLLHQGRRPRLVADPAKRL